MNFELIQTLLSFLDPHLSIVILEYYEDKENQIFDQAAVHKEKLKVLMKTNIINYIQTEFEKETNPPANLHEVLDSLKQKIGNDVKGLLQMASKFFEVFEEKEKDLEKEKFSKSAVLKIPEFQQIPKEALEATARYSRTVFDIGQYAEALKRLPCLYHLMSNDDENIINVLWGKILSEILLKSFDDAKEDFKALKQRIDNTPFKQNQHQLNQRAHLMHTALWLFFSPRSSESDYDSLIDLYSSEHYLGAIQMIAPHLTRYLLAALLLSKNSQKYGNFNMNSFVNLLNREVTNYSDSLIEFIKLTLIEYDFDQAQLKLKELSKELQKDYFLGDKLDSLINSAQTIFFETYCRIYSGVEIKTVSTFLNIQEEEAEVWIVNLIRNANIEAKIDSEKGVIVISKLPPYLNEQIKNKTRDFIPRSNLLINNIKRIFQQQKLSRLFK